MVGDRTMISRMINRIKALIDMLANGFVVIVAVFAATLWFKGLHPAIFYIHYAALGIMVVLGIRSGKRLERHLLGSRHLSGIVDRESGPHQDS